MESRNSPVGEKESPSQENIAHPQLIKRDGESLEDFEDITKDEPSMKDLTAEFLQFETGGRTEYPKREPVFHDNDQFDFEPKNDDIFESKNDDIFESKNDDIFESKNDDIFESKNDDIFESKNNDIFDMGSSGINVSSLNSGTVEPSKSLSILDQDDFGETFPDIKSDTLETNSGNSVSNVLHENKLASVVSNDEISVGSDDLSFIPKRGESSPKLQSDVEKDFHNKPPLESKSGEAMKFSFNPQPASKFTSEPSITNIQEPELLQGDGLPLKKNVEYDLSDNEDDTIPEPIPRDYPEIGALEGKQFLAAIGLDTWFHPELLHPKVESLIYWRDPKKSGIVFGAILIILLSLTSFSLISVVAYTSLTALVAALAFRIYKSVMQAVQKTSEGHPFKEYLDIDLTMNPDRAREIADVAVTHINKTLTEVRRLFLVEDVVDSVKFGVLLWGLTYIGAWFNGLSLIIIAFVGLFTLPKVYENNKTQIDTNIDLVKSKINEYTEKITAVIPLGKKTEEVKDKGE